MGVLIDTSVWIPYLKGEKKASLDIEMDRLIRSREAVMAGPVLAELLQGALRSKDLTSLALALDGLAYEEMNRSMWIRAGQINFELRRAGRMIPLSDAILAGIALEKDHSLYTFDSHFRRIKDLKIHRPLKA